MEYKEIVKIVDNKFARTFLVTFNDGAKKKVKMWYSECGVCMMNKKSRRWGHPIFMTDDYDRWVNLAPYVKTEVDVHKRVVRRAKKVEKMLDESGLWANIKKMLHTFLYERNEEEQKTIIGISLDYKRNFDLKDAMLDRMIFESLASDKCFKTINWFGYEKECYEKLLEERIKAKEDFKYFWHKGYDNRLSVEKNKNGILLGYYSEEYTGCANGYYYLLLDAKHALFYEKD